MNIVTPIPNSFSSPTNPVGTDSVRRDNLLREFIPAITQGEKSAAGRALGNDGERGNQAANQANLFQNPTYDRPALHQAFTNDSNAGANKDNASEQSAGKENAESKQEQEQENNDNKKVDELKGRDREVRIHEQAHAAAGGQYAGAPSYEYETGPDGKRYAVAGEVSIDVSAEKTPAETIQKMQQVKAAALAPAEPSAQDYKVASEATQKEQDARSELSKEQSAEVFSGKQGVPELFRNMSSLSDSAQRTASVVSRFYTAVGMQAENNLSSLA